MSNSTSERLAEANVIGKATSLLENMNTRLACGKKGWKAQQLADWQALRLICNSQIARAELAGRATTDTTPLPLEAV